MKPCHPPQCRGFSLIELMIVVAVVGILAAVAYPAFTSYVQRSRRADAVALLAAVVQAQERYRANRSAYASSLVDLGITANSITRHYTLSISGVGNPAGLATGYVATATVVSASPQTHDTRCISMGIELDGATLTYVAADSGGNVTSAYCWAR